jgi:hypothetical protein
VRLQPSHQPVAGSIRQMLVQGLGGWCMGAEEALDADHGK